MVTALSFAGAASAATVYNFNLDTPDPSSDLGAVSDAGTIEVTDTGVDLFIKVTLDNGFQFRHAPDDNHHTFVFQSDLGHATITNFNHPYFTQTAGATFSDSPFGNSWNNAIDCAHDQQATGAGCSNGAKAGNPTTLSFKVAGITFTDLVPKAYTGTKGPVKIYFAADLVGGNGVYLGRTGNIGATWDGVPVFGVPEPGTWAMMIVGFGFVGAGLRRRRADFVAA